MGPTIDIGTCRLHTADDMVLSPQLGLHWLRVILRHVSNRSRSSPFQCNLSCVLVALSFDMARSVPECHRLEIGITSCLPLSGENLYEVAGAYPS